MFIKLTTLARNNPLLLDAERIISAEEEPTETIVLYAEPEGTGQKNLFFHVKETVDEILEKIQEAREGLYE